MISLDWFTFKGVIINTNRGYIKTFCEKKTEKVFNSTYYARTMAARSKSILIFTFNNIKNSLEFEASRLSYNNLYNYIL